MTTLQPGTINSTAKLHVTTTKIFSVHNLPRNVRGWQRWPSHAPIRILIAMSILKEGCGCSDETLYENCCFNMLYRSALGLAKLDERCHSIDSYYTLRRNMTKYQEKTGVDLLTNASRASLASRLLNAASQAKPSAWTANSYQATSPGFHVMRSSMRL